MFAADADAAAAAAGVEDEDGGANADVNAPGAAEMLGWFGEGGMDIELSRNGAMLLGRVAGGVLP